MSVADLPALSSWLYGIVAGATTLPVFNHIPPEPYQEHIRIDALNVSDVSPKNAEVAEHSWMVHYFGTGPAFLGTARAEAVIVPIHAAIMAARFQGRRPRNLMLEVMPDEDGRTIHGMARYAMTI